MAHRMGLAKLDMTTGKSVSNTITYNYTSGTTPTPLTSGSATIYPEHSFNPTSGYCYPLDAATAGTDCYYVVKSTGASTSTPAKFGCSTTNTTEYWSDVTLSGIGFGKCITKTITSNRNAKFFVATFSYCGACQTVTLPWYGNYKFECWGANGGNGLTHASATEYNSRGYGGYTKGNITLPISFTIYAFVGGVGANGIVSGNASGGWNGGGNGCPDGQDDEAAGGGGGATDFRLSVNNSKTWNDVASLCSRIMVAGGGGGGSYYSLKGGCGGGTYGGFPSCEGTAFTTDDGNPSSQTTGYQFGTGQTGIRTVKNYDTAGGGGGYYGGVCSRQGTTHADWDGSPGYGGSGFISGHNGCNAVSASVTNLSNISHSGNSNHYSGKVFSSTEMIDGEGRVWTSTTRPASATKLSTITSNPGGNNGYAKITSQ